MRIATRPRTAQLAVVAALATAVAACAGGDDDTAAASGSTGPATTATAPTTAVAPTGPDASTPTPEPTAPQTTAPATTAPATSAPATSAPQTTAPHVTAPHATGPGTTVRPGRDARPPTIDELLADRRVLAIAHAGGDQDHPHSTMYAFRESVAAGADMLELDVRLTADGVLIVQHDADTAKTTPEPLVVAETDLATLQALDNAYWWSPQCWPCHDLAADAYPFRGVRTGDTPPPAGYTPDDFRIVTLREVAEAFPTLPLDIEIKGEGQLGLDVAAALAAELAVLDRLDSAVVAAFDAAVVEHFHALAPDVAVSPGVADMAAWLLDGEALPEHYEIVQVPPFYGEIEVLSEATLATARAAGVAVWVWPNDAATQEHEAYYRELVAMGVDGIIAGRPAHARAAIDAPAG